METGDTLRDGEKRMFYAKLKVFMGSIFAGFLSLKNIFLHARKCAPF